eukprot:SAG31_NODE_8237_length_1491_cov_13.210063_1_plen_75_part_00
MTIGMRDNFPVSQGPRPGIFANPPLLESMCFTTKFSNGDEKVAAAPFVCTYVRVPVRTYLFHKQLSRSIRIQVY